MSIPLIRTNRRATTAVLAVSTLCALAGGVAATGWMADIIVLRIFGIICLILGVCGLAVGVCILARPRLSIRGNELLVHARAEGAVAVPLEHVECVFLGAETSETSSGAKVMTSAVIVRLAERAKEWHARRLMSVFGKWEDGYIKLYGTWCEPLGLQLLNGVNAKLTEFNSRPA